MKPRNLFSLMVLFALALAFGACGGSSSSGSASAPPAVNAGAPLGAMALNVTGAFLPSAFPTKVPTAFPSPTSPIAAATSGGLPWRGPTLLARFERWLGASIGRWTDAVSGKNAYAATTGFIAAYAPLGSWTESATGVALIPIAGSGVTGGDVSTPQTVNSCATVPSGTFVSGSTNPEAVCVSNGDDIYLIDGTTLVKTLTSAAGTNTVTFSGGACSTCGVVVNAQSGTAVISEATADGLGGYQLLDLASRTLSGVIALGPNDGVAEHFGVLPISNSFFLLLSPTEDITGADGTDYDVLTVDPTGTGKSATFDFAGRSGTPGLPSLDDTAALDSLGIIYAQDEETGDLFLADLTQATADTSKTPFTWNDAATNIQNLTELSSSDVNALAVAYGAHEALTAEEFGGTLFGAIKLPSTSGSGTPAAQDWVAANMPNDPSGTPWSNPFDPHGLTSAFVSYTASGGTITTGTQHGFGLLMNDARTYLAVIDLDALLKAPREATTGAGSHTIDPTYDLVKNNVVTFIKFP